MSGSGRAPQRAPVPVDPARAGREDARPPASELTTALHGDGSLLAPLSAQGEPLQFFWPHPDRGANVAAFALGLTQRVPGATTPADAIEGVAACATSAGPLAEQVDAMTGRPVWLVPLAWSHAFYVLACRPDHRSGSGA